LQQFISNKKRMLYNCKRFKQKRKLTQEQKDTALRREIRQSKEMYEAKRLVLIRDNYTCCLCGCSGKKNNGTPKKKLVRIEVHHIIKICDERTNIDIKNINISLAVNPQNMISLCRVCHKSINGLEEIYEEYFNYIVESRKYIENK